MPTTTRRFPLDSLDRLILTCLREQWQRDCRIIPDYMPPFPHEDTQPTVQVQHVPSGRFLRYSKGPSTGTFWDCYGEDFMTVELAFWELLKATSPLTRPVLAAGMSEPISPLLVEVP